MFELDDKCNTVNLKLLVIKEIGYVLACDLSAHPTKEFADESACKKIF